MISGIYQHSESPAYLAEMGFKLTTCNPYVEDLNALADLGMQGIVWLGAMDRTTGLLERDEDWVIARLNEVADHPAVYAFQICDEPHATIPGASAIVDARGALIKAWGDVPTYITLDRNEDYGAWTGAADIHGLVVYPFIQQPRDAVDFIVDHYSKAREAGLERIIGIPGDFETDWYRIPTDDEARLQLETWGQYFGVEATMLYQARQFELSRFELYKSFNASLEPVPEPPSEPTCDQKLAAVRSVVYDPLEKIRAKVKTMKGLFAGWEAK